MITPLSPQFHRGNPTIIPKEIKPTQSYIEKMKQMDNEDFLKPGSKKSSKMIGKALPTERFRNTFSNHGNTL